RCGLINGQNAAWPSRPFPFTGRLVMVGRENDGHRIKCRLALRCLGRFCPGCAMTVSACRLFGSGLFGSGRALALGGAPGTESRDAGADRGGAENLDAATAFLDGGDVVGDGVAGHAAVLVLALVRGDQV